MPGPCRLPARTVCGCRSTMDTKFGSSAAGCLLDRETVEDMRLLWTARGGKMRAAAVVRAHWGADLVVMLPRVARRLRSRCCVQFINADGIVRVRHKIYDVCLVVWIWIWRFDSMMALMDAVKVDRLPRRGCLVGYRGCKSRCVFDISELFVNAQWELPLLGPCIVL